MLDDAPQRPTRPLIQCIGAVLWPSFFSAAAAMALMVTCVDPASAYAALRPGHTLATGWICTAAFCLLWLTTASSSAVTALLMRPVATADDGYPLE